MKIIYKILSKNGLFVFYDNNLICFKNEWLLIMLNNSRSRNKLFEFLQNEKNQLRKRNNYSRFNLSRKSNKQF